jgi:hypothetical protein
VYKPINIVDKRWKQREEQKFLPFFRDAFLPIKTIICGWVVGPSVWINGTNLWINRSFWGEQMGVSGYRLKNRPVFEERVFWSKKGVFLGFSIHKQSRGQIDNFFDFHCIISVYFFFYTQALLRLLILLSIIALIIVFP